MSVTGSPIGVKELFGAIAAQPLLELGQVLSVRPDLG